MEDVLMNVLKVLGAIGLVVMVWLIVEGALTVRKLRKTVGNLEERIEPTLANVENITESLQPAIEKVDPLMERVQLTVDSVNLELMQVDKILGDASQMTGTASSAVKKMSDAAGAPSRAVNGAATKLRSVFGKKKNEALIENAMKTAELSPVEEPQVDGLTAFDIARDWAAEASGEYAESIGGAAEKPTDEPQPQAQAPVEGPAIEVANAPGDIAEAEVATEPEAAAEAPEPADEPIEAPKASEADVAPTAEQKIAEALAQLERESTQTAHAYQPPKPMVAKSASELVEEALREE